jgi:hypothetical protein
MDRKDKVSQGWVLAFYTAAFRLALDSRYTTVRLYVDMILNLLYELSFPLALPIKGSSVFPVTGFRILRLWWIDDVDIQSKRAAAYSIATLILLNFCYFGYLVCFYRSRRINIKSPRFLAKVMEFHISFSCSFLFIPYVSIMLNYVACPNKDLCSFGDMSSGESFFLVVVALAHFVFTFFYYSALFEWSPQSRYLGSKSSCGCCIIASSVRSLVTFVFALLTPHTSFLVNYALLFFGLIPQLMVCLNYAYKMPFYSLEMNQMVIATYAFGFISSVSVFFAIITGAVGDSVCIAVIIVGILLLIPTISFMTTWRCDIIQKKPLIKLSAVEVDIRARLGILRIVALLEEAEGGKEDVRQSLLSEMDSFFRFHSKTSFGKSVKFNLIWATYLHLFKTNKLSGMQKLRQVLSHARFYESLPVRIRMRFLAEAYSTEEVDAGLTTYEESQRLETYAAECMAKCMGYQVQFWGLLVTGDYTLEKLENIASSMSKLSNQAKKSLQRLVKISPKIPFYRRLYSQFLACIENDDTGAKKQLSRAVELEGDETVQNITSSENSIIVISGEEGSVGRILHFNKKACSMFGVSLEVVANTKINTLMARPFGLVHDHYLTSYVDNKNSVTSFVSRPGLFMKGSDGFVFEADLQVVEYSNFTLDPSIAFLGALTRPRTKPFCIIKKADLVVWDVSSPFFYFFDLDLQRVKNLDYFIMDIIPDFKVMLEDIKQGFVEGIAYSVPIKYVKSDTQVHLDMTVSNLKYYEEEFYHVLLEEKKSVVESASVEDYEGSHATIKPGLVSILLDGSEKKPRGNRRVKISTEELIADEKSSKSGSFISCVESELGDKPHSKASSASSKNSNLLRMGLLRSDKRLEKSLLRVLVFLVVVLFALSIMSIVDQIAWSKLISDRFRVTNDMLSIPVSYGISSLSYSASLLSTILHGTTLYSNETVASAKQHQVLNDMAQAQSALDQLQLAFLTHSSVLGDEVVDVFSSANCLLIDYGLNKVNVTLLDFIQVFSISSTSIVASNLSEVDPGSRALHLFLRNRDNKAHDIWDSITSSILKAQREHNEYIKSQNVSFALAGILCAVCAILFVLLPVVYSVRRTGLDVYKLFEKMDPSSVREIYTQSIGKLSDIGQTQSAATFMVELQLTMETLALKKPKTDGVTAATLHLPLWEVLQSRPMRLFMFMWAWTLLYFVGSTVWWNQTEAHIYDLSSRLYVAKSKQFYIREIARGALQWDHHLRRFRPDVTAIAYFEKRLLEAEESLYNGNDSLGIQFNVQSIYGGAELLEKSVCALFQDNHGQLSEATTACDSVHSGMLNKGVQQVVLDYIQLSEQIRANSTQSSPPATVDASQVIELTDLADNVLFRVCDVVNQWIQDTFNKTYSQALTLRQLGCFSFVVGCLALLWCVYLPLIRKMNRDLKNTINLLLMIPPEIVESSTMIRDNIRSIALRKLQND